MDATNIVKKQRLFFESHQTLSYEYRKTNLDKLRNVILLHIDDLSKALKLDLGKSAHESYLTEIGVVLKELTYMQKHLKRLMKPKKVKTHITDFPAKSVRYSDPYGVTLIISPWNYPVNLALAPLIGAIAAGNTAIVKPSEFSVHTSKVLEKIISKTFDDEYIKVVLGGVDVNQNLLDQRFDYIFFTGSSNVGKIVMEKASKHLTPVSLELGGKSPAIVDVTANIKLAAKRITFGKFLNAGQTCVAPDYVYIHENIKDDFIHQVKKNIEAFYGKNPIESDIYGSIINDKHYNRLSEYLKDGKHIIGGTIDANLRKIEPTILDNVSKTSPVMTEEIFGPILPIITYKNIDEVISFVTSRSKPLALYLFSNDKNIQTRVMRECYFGGGCINDTIVHVASDYLPFGGVGESGMGSYHGRQSFATFSHYKSILKKAVWFDLPMRYAPYSDFKKKTVKRFLK
mgnify:CR=1 FL=1